MRSLCRMPWNLSVTALILHGFPLRLPESLRHCCWHGPTWALGRADFVLATNVPAIRREVAMNNASRLIGKTIDALNGEIGSIYDLYFDDQTWSVRYLVV